MFNEASKNNLFESLPRITCPVYFIAGRKDYQTNSEIAYKYFEQLHAPKKDFFWIENAGHSIPANNGLEMQQLIIQKVIRGKRD